MPHHPLTGQIAQRHEANDLGSLKCGFESLSGYMNDRLTNANNYLKINFVNIKLLYIGEYEVNIGPVAQRQRHLT